MKQIFPLLFSACLIVQGCGLGLGQYFETKPNPTIDSTAITVKKVDTLPHEVSIGKNKQYAFMADSCFNSLVLGDPKSFKEYRLMNGAQMVKLDGDRKKMAYLNTLRTEEMEVLVTGDERTGFFPYKMTVLKARSNGGHVFSETHEVANKGNFISGHGIYIGMSPDYVLNVYQNQVLMQWQTGDTLYLQFKPKEKDAKYFVRYNWKSYTATYKFVDDQLKRMEYEVDPSEFEHKN